MFKGGGYSGSWPLWKVLGERNFTVIQFETKGQFFSIPYRYSNDKIMWVLYDEFYPQDQLNSGIETAAQLLNDFDIFAQRGTQIITSGHDGPLNNVVDTTIQLYRQIESKYPYLYYITTNDLIKYYNSLKTVDIKSLPWSNTILVSNPPAGLSFMVFPSNKNVESSSGLGRGFRLTVSATNTTLKFAPASTAHVYACSGNLSSLQLSANSMEFTLSSFENDTSIVYVGDKNIGPPQKVGNATYSYNETTGLTKLTIVHKSPIMHVSVSWESSQSSALSNVSPSPTIIPSLKSLFLPTIGTNPTVKPTESSHSSIKSDTPPIPSPIILEFTICVLIVALIIPIFLIILNKKRTISNI
jgi:hypothetical protein